MFRALLIPCVVLTVEIEVVVPWLSFDSFLKYRCFDRDSHAATTAIELKMNRKFMINRSKYDPHNVDPLTQLHLVHCEVSYSYFSVLVLFWSFSAQTHF